MRSPKEIEQIFLDFESLALDRNDIGNERDGCIISCKKINGGEELRVLLNDFKKTKKNQLNKAVFVFMKALKTFAGDIYKGHDIHELTGGQSLKGLEQRAKIYDLVVEECGYNQEVIDIMKWWLACADLLFEVSTILKS